MVKLVDIKHVNIMRWITKKEEIKKIQGRNCYLKKNWDSHKYILLYQSEFFSFFLNDHILKCPSMSTIEPRAKKRKLSMRSNRFSTHVFLVSILTPATNLTIHHSNKVWFNFSFFSAHQYLRATWFELWFGFKRWIQEVTPAQKRLDCTPRTW